MRKPQADALRQYAADHDKRYQEVKGGILELYRLVKKCTKLNIKVRFLHPQLGWMDVPPPHLGGINRFVDWFTAYHFKPKLSILLYSFKSMQFMPVKTDITDATARIDAERAIQKL